MIIVPNQPFGIGDIIFCQSLVRHIAGERKIVWPVWPQFVDQLRRAYPGIEFINSKVSEYDLNRNDQFEGVNRRGERYTQLPIRFADSIMRVHYDDCMKSKYMMYGLDFNMWVKDAMWHRDTQREESLMQLLVKKEEYTFSNATFGSDCKMQVPVPNCDVKMQILDGFSMFDWCKIIENASEIHTVSTSIIYLLEMLELKAKEVHLYQRPIPGQTFSNVSYILQRHKYILHG